MSVNDTYQGPVSADELVLLDNIPATEPVPEEISSRLNSKQVFITGGGGAIRGAESLARVEGDADSWQIQLPGDAIIGRPGRRAERFEAGALTTDAASASETDANRPAWVDQIYHPKRSIARSPQIMRSIKGNRVIPAYGVFGNDDRQVFYPSGYPWQCVGRVFTWEDASQASWSWSGSGVLVGSRVLLTAGHVVPWASSNWKVLFVPGYYDGGSVVGAGATSWVSDAQGWNTDDHVAAHDMAVLRLYDPLGDALGWFGSKTYDRSWQDQPFWEVVGYPGALAGAERPSYQLGIPVLDDDSDGDAEEIEHQGDVTAGDSGGPFFSFWADGFPYVIGTISGGESISGSGAEDNNIAAGGKAMVDLIIWALANWPA